MAFLSRCLILVFLCSKVLQNKASSWTVKLPSSVKGLVGSCVVIPCTFDYPAPAPGKQLTRFTGIWNNAEHQVIYHPVQDKVLQQYRGRTKLLGDTSQKNCSLMIDPLQQSDSGPFIFRIEIADYDNYSYKSPVSIRMISEPISVSVKDELKEGENVSVSCSASYSCPASPPDFNWNHSGEKVFHTEELDAGQWRATSTLTFHLTRADHEKNLLCTVRYIGGKQRTESKVLKVKYGPEIKTMSSCSRDADTNKVKCVCIVESRPPSMVHFVLSDRIQSKASIEKHGPIIIGTLQTEYGSSEFVHCLANNTQGTANVTLYFPVNSKMQSVFTYIATGTGLILVLLLIAVEVKKCRGRPEENATTHLSTMKEGKDVMSSQYAAPKSRGRPEKNTTTPLSTMKEGKDVKSPREETSYDNVDFPDVYGNDPVYGNMETDLDDAIYANV
ncbi:myelin-associated glycoprotein-like isoform X2 [Xyrichtys novacula]|uniref:Myelin-associated glycoprotein-like isoform X2 n=1 Tax=Xyrichtys novacula TaxID=13765 RepID=A0AAV1FKR4_XYRNO|nr:myelin-associated glycoprotein-like isoform X2 [Xyrichtys novacula]